MPNLSSIYYLSFQTPCCGKFYKCRYCHDENEDHHFDRKTLTELICTKCDTRQKVQAECENCNVRFGKVISFHFFHFDIIIFFAFAVHMPDM